MASSPSEEYQQWHWQHLHTSDKWKRSRDIVVAATPPTQNSTPNTSSLASEDLRNAGSRMRDDGYRQQQQQQHHLQQQPSSSYWTPQQQERSFRLDSRPGTTPLACSNNRPKLPTAASSSSPIQVIMSSPLPLPLPCDRVMRDATNTSSMEVHVVESRALFPDSLSSDEDYPGYHGHDDDDALEARTRQEPHKVRLQVVDCDHDDDGKEQTTAAWTLKHGALSRGMKSRRKHSPDHHEHHQQHLLTTPDTSCKVSNQMPTTLAPTSGYRLDQHHEHQQQPQYHHHGGGGTSVHPALLHHERSNSSSENSSLSTLSSLDDGTCDGSAQTSPHPYRRPLSSVLVVSSSLARNSNSVLRRISTTLPAPVVLTDSHSLPPLKVYKDTKGYMIRNHHHHPDMNPVPTTTFVDAAAATTTAAAAADGAAVPSSGSRGGAAAHRVPTATKSLLRLAATNNGLLWIMCFMALSSVSMTVLTSRMLKSLHDQPMSITTTALSLKNRPGSGSVLFPPNTVVQRVLIPVHQHVQQQQQQPKEQKHDGKNSESTTAVVEKLNKPTDVKHGQPKRQPAQKVAAKNKKETSTSATKRRHVQEDRTAPTSKVKNDKDTTQQHKTEVDTKVTPTTIQSIFNLKPIQVPKSTIAEKRKEPIDHKLYRTRSFKGMVQEPHRRIIYMHESMVHQKPKPRKLVQYPADFTDSTQLYSVLDSGDERVRKSMEMRDPYVQGECVPMQDWQTTFHPSCNHVHALGLDRMGDEADSRSDAFDLFGTKGFWRHAWKVQVKTGGQNRTKNNSGEDVIVLKTLKIQHQFEDAHFEHNRIDAVAMEQLTSSPHVINIFGFCGHSVMTEYADGTRLGALADKSRSTPLARLRIARDIATGLADVHGIDGDGNTTFVHLDVNPANIVSIGGTLKLNDFNIGIIRRWNTTSKEPCGFPAQYPNPQWRSPEEARNELTLTEKVDVFSMGHIFFRLICGHEPWNKLEPGGKPSKTEMNEKVKQGILPTIPSSVLQSTDKEVVAIREAMLQCYKFNPKDRPTARKIAKALQGALDKLER